MSKEKWIDVKSGGDGHFFVIGTLFFRGHLIGWFPFLKSEVSSSHVGLLKSALYFVKKNKFFFSQQKRRKFILVFYFNFSLF